MKNLVVLFFFMGFMACDSASDKSPIIVDKPVQVKDTIPVPEEEPVDDGRIAGIAFPAISVNILFTDSYNVSVFETKRGKRWKVEDVTVSYVIPGEEHRPSYSYVEGENLGYIFPISRINDDNPDKPEPWLKVIVCGQISDENEFSTALLTFPDGSVDTIVGQRYTPVTPHSDLKHVWYNSELVVSWDLYSKEPLGTYPDGSFIYRGSEFQIVKE
jgi:hypothetical protein